MEAFGYTQSLGLDCPGTAFGPLLSVAPGPASVSSTNPLRSRSLDGVNRSNCPLTAFATLTARSSLALDYAGMGPRAGIGGILARERNAVCKATIETRGWSG